MEKNLTEGNITQSLIRFSIPLILGNLLQQLYNVIDTYVVGRYIGSQALAAVGSSYTLMTFLTSIIIGLCMGSGILFSMYYGAKKEDDMKVSFFVSFVSIGIFTIFIEILCYVMLPIILQWLHIPSDIYQDTSLYLMVVFSGISFTFLYNYFASMLRALGNSKIPLLFLAMAALVNIIGDIVCVVCFSMGVFGVALATVFSQAISAIGLMLYVFCLKKELLPKRQHMHFETFIFKKMKDYSLMTCLQQGIMNFGILMIQGLVNSFGLSVMSAFSAAVKIDSFAYMPVQDFGNAFSTFVAQNKGAKQIARIHEGLKISLKMTVIFCLLISVLICVFAPQLMTIFISTKEIDIIDIGVTYLRIEGSFYIGIGVLFLLYGYYRGIAKMQMSLILTTISLGTRVILSYLLTGVFGVEMIWWSIVIGWLLSDCVGLIYGFKVEKWRL